jgi:alpha-L-fucosidase
MTALLLRRSRTAFLSSIAIVLCVWIPAVAQTPADESPAARDARMSWWRDARFGMFIHWGVYSVPARGEWVMYNEKIPVAEYEKFPPQFNPVNFNATEWVRIAKSGGARYIVITSKHHDGFCMWDSRVSTYDIMDATPFKRDVLRELADACKKEGIRLCFYHSIMDWHHPDAKGERFPEYRDKYLKPQLEELIKNYAPLGVLWFDGQWIAEWDEEQGRALYTELRKLQPDLIINNRIGKGRNDPGVAEIGDFGTPEQYIPTDELGGFDWESCMTMNDHWGYAAKDSNWKSVGTLVNNLVDIASKGGNYLLNVGPTAKGEIPQESVARLQAIGRWLKVNGESIYGTTASPFEATPWGRSTQKILPDGRRRLYLHIFDWPKSGMLMVQSLGSDPDKAVLLGSNGGPLTFRRAGDTLLVTLPARPSDTLAAVVALEFPGRILTYRRPVITTTPSMFLDRTTVQFKSPPAGVEIRYTLDGTNPGASSPRYQDAIVLTSTKTVKAQTFHKGKGVGPVVEQIFSKVAPRPAATVSDLAPGLKYEYFETREEKLPAFDSLKPAASGVIDSLAIQKWWGREHYALRFTGYLTVPEDGIYMLSLSSDDGSRLALESEIVIDNDGLHSSAEKRGYAALAKGAHPIAVTYFNGPGDAELILKIARDKEQLKPVSSQFYSHVR